MYTVGLFNQTIIFENSFTTSLQKNLDIKIKKNTIVTLSKKIVNNVISFQASMKIVTPKVRADPDFTLKVSIIRSKKKHGHCSKRTINICARYM